MAYKNAQIFCIHFMCHLAIRVEKKNSFDLLHFEWTTAFAIQIKRV